jgi:hypothetical protein
VLIWKVLNGWVRYTIGYQEEQTALFIRKEDKMKEKNSSQILNVLLLIGDQIMGLRQELVALRRDLKEFRNLSEEV